jgi:flagellar basal body-associated protein FliL
MAEKNNKPSKTDSVTDDDVTPENAKTAAGAKPMPWLVLIVGILVMLLTPTASYFLVKLTQTPAATTEQEASEQEASEPEVAKKEGHGAKKEGHGAKKEGHGAKKGGHGKAEGKEKEGGEKDSATFNMSSMLINIAETKGTRILKITPHLMLSEPEMSAKLAPIKALLVDTIATVTSGKTLDELDGPTGRDNLKKAIVLRVNKLLESRMTGSVVDIYFEEFLIQ